MKVRKFSVLVLVVVFHVVVLGVVYLATRPDEQKEEENTGEISNTETPKPKIEPNTNTSGENNQQTNTTPPKPKPSDPKPKPKPPVYTGKTIIHVVAKGDYLGKIASKYKVSAQQIMTVNNLRDPNKILPGQKLKIPVKD